MRTVIIGVGNPTLTDDGVGIRAAEQLADHLTGTAATAGDDAADGHRADTVDVTVLCAGGLRLMEAMVGYHRAIVLDALATGSVPAGTTVELAEDDLATTRNLASVHDLSLPYALDLGRAIGVELPGEIRVFGVRTADVTTFGEELSTEVAAAVPALVDRVLSLLTGDTPERMER